MAIVQLPNNDQPISVEKFDRMLSTPTLKENKVLQLYTEYKNFYQNEVSTSMHWQQYNIGNMVSLKVEDYSRDNQPYLDPEHFRNKQPPLGSEYFDDARRAEIYMTDMDYMYLSKVRYRGKHYGLAGIMVYQENPVSSALIKDKKHLAHAIYQANTANKELFPYKNTRLIMCLKDPSGQLLSVYYRIDHDTSRIAEIENYRGLTVITGLTSDDRYNKIRERHPNIKPWHIGLMYQRGIVSFSNYMSVSVDGDSLEVKPDEVFTETILNSHQMFCQDLNRALTKTLDNRLNIAYILQRPSESAMKDLIKEVDGQKESETTRILNSMLDEYIG